VSYAEALKSLRLAYRLTQVEFAELLQVSKPTIQKLEAGDYPPSEKMTARLAELFRSEKFRNEFRPRVDAGDLRPVGIAFGGLLEIADAEAAALSPASPMPVIPDNPVNTDQKFWAMMCSQQNTIENLSESGKSLADSQKNFSESTKSLAEAQNNLSESSKSLAKSQDNLSESTKSLADAQKDLSRSNKNLSETTKDLAESNKNLSERLAKSRIS